MLTRRDGLRLSATSCLTGSLAACATQLPSCPIGWVPTMLAPVFYGYRDYVACRLVNAPPSPASVGVGNVSECGSFSETPPILM